MSLDGRRAGEALATAASELTRIWRAARAEASPDVFPGLSDGLVERFVAGLGEALVLGRPAEDVWARAEGVVRLDPAASGLAEDELRAEWRLVGEVIAAACDALEAGPEVTDVAARAVELARGGLESIRGGGPPAIVRVVSFSPLRPLRGGVPR
ncbi:hypothetical protein [Anaeromyxobacter oryzae]|uniref:Uncharacterized protein n=1 Tax=Anaeromyxobacter oryzae TaxID=2918170 RepID=A0ABN6MP52_9BACT|nr:hypothetical protein [Anaeromyxobacter oryzae]BDG02786.1 hypothetical protein AMOR_17820 [Anaeromyxobacter oryzae]